nr:AraC family transcriptional regulator [uncultured Mediterraneibacter sp.]
MTILFRSTPVSEPLTFESIGQDWKQDPVTRPGGYPFYHYLQTEKGAGRIETASGSFLLRENEGILIAPFIRHSYSSTDDEWYTKFATFTGTAASCIPQIVGNRQIIRIDSGQGEQVSRLIQKCVSLYDVHPPDEKQLSVLCYTILLTFTDGIYTKQLTDEPLYQNYVSPVIKEIELNYNLPLSVEAMSRKVFVTPQYLSRLFRRYLNCSAYEYLTSYRIAKAKELLITSPSLEIQDICHRVGFSDASHFIAIFKKTVGVTPLEFRKLN